MTIPTVLEYLTNTNFALWDFEECINLIKEEFDYNNNSAFSYLNNLLKTKFNNNSATNNWIKNWASLIKNYEKLNQGISQPRTAGPTVFLANSQTNYVSTYQTVNQAQQPTQQQPSTKSKGKKVNLFSEEEEEEEDEEEEDLTADFRSLVFKTGYDFFKSGKIDMMVIRRLNRMVSKHHPTTLAGALDVLSYELLTKKINPAQTNALKLSLSRILCFDGCSLAVFEEFFNRQDHHIKALYQKAKTAIPVLPAGLTEEMQKIFSDLITHSNDDDDFIRARVSKMKADLLFEKGHNKELIKMLDILDYLIMNFEAKSSKESELTCYRKTAYILDILFRNTPFKLIDGEHSSEATKGARNVNMRATDDDGDKKDLMGRKIDLIIKGSEVEISSSEWKKPAVTAKTIEEQRIKNIRTNSAMLHKLSELVGRDNLALLGMDWVGFVGMMFSIIQVSDVHCVHIIGDLVFPQTMNVLGMFNDTLNLLYSFKHHNLNLLDLAVPALERKEVENQLKKMTSSNNEPPVRSAPVTFFTPKKKRERKD